VQYGPCQVSALAGDGGRVQIDCQTDYPFNESIEMIIKPAKASTFPLLLRIPTWCKRPVVSVNSSAIDAVADAKGFVRIHRKWNKGDTVHLHFSMTVEVANGSDKNLKPAAPYATVS